MFEYIGYIMHTINVIPNDNSFVIIKSGEKTYKVLMAKPFSQSTLFVYKLDNAQSGSHNKQVGSYNKIADNNLEVRYTIDKTDIIYDDINYVFNNVSYYHNENSKKVEIPYIYFNKISQFYVGYNSTAYSVEMDQRLRNIHSNIIYHRQ